MQYKVSVWNQNIVKSRSTIAYFSLLNRLEISKFGTEHDSITECSMKIPKRLYNWITVGVIDERYFARFRLRMIFDRISDIAHAIWFNISSGDSLSNDP